MAKHAPKPIDRRDVNVAVAKAAADEASLDAWWAHLSAEAAHDRLDMVEEAGVKTCKAMSDISEMHLEHICSHIEQEDRAFVYAAALYIAAIALVAAGCLYEPAGVAALPVLGAAIATHVQVAVNRL